MIEIFERNDDAAGSVLAFLWREEGEDAIEGSLTSCTEGVTLRVGPTVSVAHWPKWLRANACFGPDGGVATMRLDPGRSGTPDDGIPRALDMRGVQSRRALASFLQTMAAAIAECFPFPSPEQQQALDVCTGLAPPLSSDSHGIRPGPAESPALFLPSSLPVIVDDVNTGHSRHHVRLTYPLPLITGRWSDGCSLRLFRNDHSFGLEFRSLAGDHLPHQLRAACVLDAFGPLIRFTIERGDGKVTVEGHLVPETERVARAIARQVSRDLTAENSEKPFTGFEAAPWRHWLAALPDLLASPSPMPLGASGS